MLIPGNIILFTPFYFKNGATPKDKFFIVLHAVDNSIILASLPTSVNRSPTLVNVNHGCINHDDRCYNAYLFEPNRIISDSGFYFNLPTFIYGNEVEDYNISTITAKYQNSGSDYQIKGQLKQNEFTSLLDCLKNSGNVKRGIKRILSS